MGNLRKRFEAINYYTLLKYFLSYFFVLSFLLLCFFFAFRSQLKNAYSTERDKSIQEKLHLFQQNFSDELAHIFNIHYNLCNNDNLKMLSYSPDSAWYSSQSISDMRGFAGANPLLLDIVYIEKYNGNILACNNYVYQSGEDYYFRIDSESLEIPVGKYGHDNCNSMVYIQNRELSRLLLFPNVESKRYDLFYVIDEREILSSFSDILSEEISGIYLTDAGGRMIAASGKEQQDIESLLNGGINRMELEKREKGETVVYTIPLHTDLFLAVCFSKDSLLQYANKAFINLYLLMTAIGLVGLVLILFGMKFTYVPLHRLGQKYVGKPGVSGSLEAQLDRIFSSALMEQKHLQEKINKYHNLMKESVLDTIVNENGEEITEESMERLFNGEPGNLIFVVQISTFFETRRNGAAAEEFRQYFQETFPNQDSLCIRLESNREYSSYLIYYGGKDQDKYNVLKYLLSDYQKKTGCKIAMSNASSSPLDIPALYANAVKAGKQWGITPTAFYDELDVAVMQAESYPYQDLSNFAALLHQQKFEAAALAIEKFFTALNRSERPNFYIRSVLTEILTIMVSDMNQQNIRFSSYNNLYFETLYYIRSCSWEEKKEDIYHHFIELIRIFEDELSNLTIQSSQLQSFVNDNFASSELSIGMLAEKFHVSIAYMSYLFKKYFNENFSDYLWKLRVERAKELLRTTGQPVEEICVAVGYENVSSFRRKFKKELGITPSQYRNGDETVTDT